MKREKYSVSQLYHFEGQMNKISTNSLVLIHSSPRSKNNLRYVIKKQHLSTSTGSIILHGIARRCLCPPPLRFVLSHYTHHCMYIYTYHALAVAAFFYQFALSAGAKPTPQAAATAECFLIVITGPVFSFCLFIITSLESLGKRSY